MDGISAPGHYFTHLALVHFQVQPINTFYYRGDATSKASIVYATFRGCLLLCGSLSHPFLQGLSQKPFQEL